MLNKFHVSTDHRRLVGSNPTQPCGPSAERFQRSLWSAPCRPRWPWFSRGSPWRYLHGEKYHDFWGSPSWKIYRKPFWVQMMSEMRVSVGLYIYVSGLASKKSCDLAKTCQNHDAAWWSMANQANPNCFGVTLRFIWMVPRYQYQTPRPIPHGWSIHIISYP